MLFSCKVSLDVWLVRWPQLGTYFQNLSPLVSWVDLIKFVINHDKLLIFGYVVWSIWKNQNMACFKGGSFMPPLWL